MQVEENVVRKVFLKNEEVET